MNRLQHYFNSLHFYCLLCKLGIKKKAARRIAILYEFATRRILYRSQTVSGVSGE